MDRPPEETAWDNVIYESPALGYVVATHMSLRSQIDRSVWTFYWSLAQGPPAQMRTLLLEKDWAYWREAILNDLSRAHPDIRERVSRIDVMRFGHAMTARPVPGFLASESRHHFATATGPVIYANSDLSGFSIFEEAQYRGVTAADRALSAGSPSAQIPVAVLQAVSAFRAMTGKGLVAANDDVPPPSHKLPKQSAPF